MPYPAYEPKSMWRPRSSPIAAIIVAEFDATARSSIRRFHTFVTGNTEQFAAPGRMGPGGIGRRNVFRRSIVRGVAVGRGRGGAYAPTGAVAASEASSSTPS